MVIVGRSINVDYPQFIYRLTLGFLDVTRPRTATLSRGRYLNGEKSPARGVSNSSCHNRYVSS